MKIITTILFVLLTIYSFNCQTFQMALGGAQEEFAYSFQQTEDNGYVVAGRTFSFGTGGWECYMARFNNAGDTLWTKTYGNVLYDELQDVDTTSDGGFIAVGHTTTTDWDGNVYLIRTNANGIVLWSKEYGGSIGLSDKGYSVRETSDGGFIITGTTETYGSGGDDVYVLKVNSTGTVQWSTTIGSAGTTSVMDAGREVQETNDGGYIVVGYTSAVDINFSDVYLIKLNSSGVVQWKKTYGGGSYDIGYTVQQTTDNGYIIGATTNSYGAGNWDAYLIKTDANGIIQWSKTYGKSGEDRAQCARQTPDGGYILCGRSSSFGAGNFDVVLYRTDATGTLLWTKGYGGTGDDQGFYVRPIGTSFVFCGYTVSFGAGIKDVFFARADATGTVGCNEITGTGFTTTSPSTGTSTIGNTSTGGTLINPSTATRNTLSVKTVMCSTPNCTVNAGNDQTVCAGVSVTLSGAGANSYTWNNGVQNGVAFVPTGTQTYTVTGTNAQGCSATDQVVVTVNPLPTVNAGNDQTACAGGSVTLSGAGTNSYTWNNGVQNGVAFFPTVTQPYTVTGTNAQGCSATDQVVVTVNPLPTVNAGNDQTACAGESVTLSGSGANTYAWNNGVQNGVAFVPTGTQTYTITGTNAQGCSATDQVVVTVNALPTVNAGNDQTVCAGASVTLSGSGANNYAWNNGVQNGVAFVPTGTQTYTVTGTDAQGCSANDQVVVTVNPLPTVNAGNDQTVCAGASVTLSGSGANNYAWNNGVQNGVAFVPTGTQTYTVTGTDAQGCSATDQVLVTVNQQTSSSQTQTALNSYTWPVNGQTYSQSGTYTETIPNSAGCDSTITLNLTLNFTGIEMETNELIKIFPNPTNDFFTVNMPAERFDYFMLFDNQGRKIIEGKFTGKETHISLIGFSAGIYTLFVDKDQIPLRIIKL